ncbi:NADH dehydrogenase ubiquinone 1 alpha subcomplex subunit 6 [Hondaea fermentalgiana]|uniref:NADH dehydrogenase ubiquinone 1 alpha subcomplex subunit 6 n=1 Tax=Hondaea fermentalgiana TaxID=2315210 RepID=A0A2R5GV61_9STRA|nr:NADH dehydrogenase ubiquinone 1 alpha subcomplex subunit 6 [Hondaea fermentalgiana]|eukprot:GBG33658.1 NADH dehydrogenase ubiquinone 1 alpha subcomplex subunit 6 [Hondaea fermentalgiana]
MASAATAVRKARVVDLYRRCLREIPRTITIFDMDMTEKEVRSRVRGLFRKHDSVTDPRAVDELLLKGELDLEETVNVWKQKTQLSRMLGTDSEPTPVIERYEKDSVFLRSFYAGHL